MTEWLDKEYYRLTGRASRFIKRFGLRIGLDEVEAQLPTDGHRVFLSGSDARLVIFELPGPAPRLDVAAVADRFHLPTRAVAIEPLAAAPLLSSGKVDYRTLARRAETLPTPVPADPGTEAALRRALRLTRLDLDRSVVELRGDSMAYLELQMHLAALLGSAPRNWEHLPLRDLLRLERRGSSSGWRTRLALQPVWADIMARVIAILAVIALHGTAWPTSRGAHLLLVLVGYSLAHFQGKVLFRGDVARTLSSMLIPIVTCYYVLITALAAFRAPIGPGWFLLLGNFETEFSFKGLIPYWYVSVYVQVVLIATLPLIMPQVRCNVAAQPFGSGLAALLAIRQGPRDHLCRDQ